MTPLFFQRTDKPGYVRLLIGCILIGWSFGASPACALSDDEAGQPKPSSKSERFLSAQTAYDEGRYAEAAELYGQLAGNGVDNIAVHYNLANARFKNGDLPAAVLHYRRAWYKAPRDPDIRTNLRFALNAAGAVEPTPSFVERIFYAASLEGWITTATAAYAVLVLMLLLGRLIRPGRRMLFKLSLLPAAVILLAAGGWWQWHQFDSHPEWVVAKTGATALFGPMEGATAHYKVPLAALVRQHGIDPKGWIEVEYDGKTGWLKEEYIRRVSP